MGIKEFLEGEVEEVSFEQDNQQLDIALKDVEAIKDDIIPELERALNQNDTDTIKKSLREMFNVLGEVALSSIRNDGGSEVNKLMSDVINQLRRR